MWYEIFKFEIQYRAKQVSTYLFFVVVFLFSLIAFDFVFEGQPLGLIKDNAPYVIAKLMAIITGIFMIITSMVMGVPIIRDFDHHIESLLFVNPITKSDYCLGRFLGSFVILLFIFSGLLAGLIVGTFMPWRDAENLLPFNFWHYLKPFLTLVLPTLFVGGSLFFVSGALSRKMIVVYTQGLVFFMASILSHAIDNHFVASVLEPLSFTAIDEMVEFWSPAEQNTQSIPLEGALLYNRVLWILIGIFTLIKGYNLFSFNIIKEEKKTKEIREADHWEEYTQEEMTIPEFTLQRGAMTSFIQLKSHSIFHFKAIIKEASFWAVVLCGAVTIFINSINIGTSFGVNSFPTTYLILEELKEMSLYFFLIILVFYPGELIWRERRTKIDGLQDVLPISDFISLAGKYIGFTLTFILLLFALLLSGIAFQTLNGYYNYEPTVYFTGLFIEILPFLCLFTFLAFFFQVISNSKFIAHILFVVFFIMIMLFGISGIGHGLFTFGGIGMEEYSDMNGYGHFMGPYLWFKLYWLAFSIILFVISVIFNIRGKETGFKNRWKLGKQRLTKPLLGLGLTAAIIFVLSGSYIFYNTNILNTFFSRSEQEAFRVAYEQNLKGYEYQTQAKIVAVNLKLDLYPKDRNYILEGHYILKNRSEVPIHEIHIQKALSDQEEIEYVRFKGGASLNNENEKFGYSIYTLNHPLLPGDSIQMDFKQVAITKGFSESNDETHIVENGTFFNNDRFPSLGYNNKYELRDAKDRKSYGLSPRLGEAKRDDLRELVNGRTGGDGSKINFEIQLSTDADQIAIAPGYLEKKWIENNRNYFHYKVNSPMINFYSIVSARYEVLQDQWLPSADSLGNPIDLEIYYHKGHEYNLERMMKSMKKSFDYFSQHFSPYFYRQMRIMEYPRYAQFAQSFPNTVPYSEAIGFVLDIDDEKDIDIPFFITAHELAHQWWGLHLVAANVQGQNLILESLAQYSALMVIKQEYSEAAVSQFLAMEMKRYLDGRKRALKSEATLELVEGQEYVYYSKGAINMYALQDYIGEEKVNLALRRFIEDWNIIDGPLQKDQYPTTIDLLAYFRAVSPDSMQYLITDLFETNTIFENEVIEANYSKLSADQYQINLNLEAAKYRADSLGTETPHALADWIDIGVYSLGEDGKEELIYLEKHKISSPNVSLELFVDQAPSKAAIDPYHKLIDKDIKNNVIVVSDEQ